jgi:hypothetical protein
MRVSNIDDLIGIGAGVLLLDPPFRFGCSSEAGEGRSPQRRYFQSMSLQEIGALPIRKIAGPNCWVLAWIPLPHVRAVPQLFDEWNVKLSGPERPLSLRALCAAMSPFSKRLQVFVTARDWYGRIGRPIGATGRRSAKPSASMPCSTIPSHRFSESSAPFAAGGATSCWESRI